jgi:hypothetical protein
MPRAAPLAFAMNRTPNERTLAEAKQGLCHCVQRGSQRMRH